MYPAMKIIVLVLSDEVIPVCIYNNIHNYVLFNSLDCNKPFFNLCCYLNTF